MDADTEPARLNSGAPAIHAVYRGPSMNPTLVAPAILEIVPYAGVQAVRSGDVLFFRLPGAAQAVVHRVVGVTPAGFITRGDNNPDADPAVVPFAAIAGRVVAAQRGARRRAIHGGRRGLARHYALRGWRLLERGMARLLHAPYHALARSGAAHSLLPPRWRPRVLTFQSTRVVMMGSQVVGHYDTARGVWLIRRPFRLFVDAAVLAAAVPGADEGAAGQSDAQM